jgi:pimeloyl-[acyl-carrier protein] methyl ester esterase
LSGGDFSTTVRDRPGRAMKLVLLPGIDGTGILFEPLIRALPPELSPVVQCYPGDRLLGYEELELLVQSSLPKTEPYIILGESFSGPLALRIAAKNPPGMKGVILSATFISNPLRYFPRACSRLIGPFVFSYWPPYLRLRARFTGFSAPALFELVERSHKKVTPSVQAARARAIINVNAEAALSACCVPILYLAGASDRLVPEHNVRRIRSINPRVRVAVLESSHMVLQTAPQEAANVITQFAAEVGEK